MKYKIVLIIEFNENKIYKTTDKAWNKKGLENNLKKHTLYISHNLNKGRENEQKQ